jgi:hypothetical protein
MMAHCRGDGCNSHKERWLKQLEVLGLYPVLQILEECPRESWRERECNWIAYFRDAGEPLTNKTDGGEGQSKGYVASPETREKISRAGKNRTPEVRARAAASTAATWADPSIREKWLIGLRKAASTEAYCAHASMRGQIRYADPAEREKTSIAMKKKWAEPGYHEKRMAVVRSPETRAKMSASAKARYRREQKQREGDVAG